jgi:hypothetical protein
MAATIAAVMRALISRSTCVKILRASHGPS